MRAIPKALGRALAWMIRSIVAAVVVLAIFAMLAYWHHTRVFRHERFHRDAWNARISNEREGSCYRGGMAEDIHRRVIKPGMSRAEVVRRLGEPDHATATELRYVLGMCSGMGFDYDDLWFRFDRAGRVQSSGIAQG